MSALSLFLGWLCRASGPEAPQGPPGVGRRKAGRSSPSAGLMETIVHQICCRRVQPRRLFEAGAATALAEPKARRSARLRAGPIPEISSNGQTRRMLSLPVPASDPVAGVSGPLTSRWRRAVAGIGRSHRHFIAGKPQCGYDPFMRASKRNQIDAVLNGPGASTRGGPMTKKLARTEFFANSSATH